MSNKASENPVKIELIGLPGSGKTTLKSMLSKAGFASPHDEVIRKCSGVWASREIIRIPYIQRILSNRIVLDYYMDRHVTNISGYVEYCACLMSLFSERIKKSSIEELSSRRFFEHVITIYKFIGHEYLLRNYSSEIFIKNNRILFDEHWLQTIAFTLNWGDESDWLAWAYEAVSQVDSPTVIVWLNNAYQVSFDRQKKKKPLCFYV